MYSRDWSSDVCSSDLNGRLLSVTEPLADSSPVSCRPTTEGCPPNGENLIIAPLRTRSDFPFEGHPRLLPLRHAPGLRPLFLPLVPSTTRSVYVHTTFFPAARLSHTRSSSPSGGKGSDTARRPTPPPYPRRLGGQTRAQRHSAVPNDVHWRRHGHARGRAPQNPSSKEEEEAGHRR